MRRVAQPYAGLRAIDDKCRLRERAATPAAVRLAATGAVFVPGQKVDERARAAGRLIDGHPPVRVLPSGYALRRPTTTEEDEMPDGSMDETKGRVKEAAGDLTGDQELKDEGKVDRASGKAKDAVGSVADKAKDLLRKD
jgi:uncharacterized protein YjbJ (UPF0337 family)